MVKDQKREHEVKYVAVPILCMAWICNGMGRHGNGGNGDRFILNLLCPFFSHLYYYYHTCRHIYRLNL